GGARPCPAGAGPADRDRGNALIDRFREATPWPRRARPQRPARSAGGRAGPPRPTAVSMGGSGGVRVGQKLIDGGGGTLEVFVGGAGGPTACNSHPFSAQSTAGPLVDALAESCQLVLVNPRGVGGSSPGREPADYTFRRHVDDLEAVRRRLGVDRWVFF